MGAIRYPYTCITSGVPSRPYINLTLRVGCATTETLYGLVDSGADYSILPLEFSKILKLNITDGRPWSFRGTTGALQMAYLHHVEMALWDQDVEKIVFRFQTEVSFCEDFKFPGGLLLGQNGFLSHFKTTFSQADDYFDLEPVNPETAT